jgi:predicted permease
VLGFTAAVSAAVGILFSVIPALRIKGAALASSLAAGRTAARVRPLFGRALVALQVALSVVLLAGASLLVRSFSNLKGVETGVGAGVLGFSLNADRTGYENERLVILQAELLQRFQALPGVQDAALTTVPPLSGNEDGKPVAVPGYEAREGENTIANVNGVTPGYFATYGVKISEGRGFAQSDSRTSGKVVVISEGLARHYFGSTNPVGKRLGFGRLRDQPAGQAEIVGVVRDALYRRSLREPPREMIYMPYSQMDEPASTVTFGIRANGNPEALTNAARREVQTLAPTALMTRARILSEQVDEILVFERLLAVLGTAFGILCLVLTSVGLYGLLAYSVARRTPEIGLRMALGAESGGVLWIVLRESLGLVMAGAAVGVAGAMILLKSASSLLYGLETTDPTSMLVAVGLLAAVALVSSAVPAIRASRIDPVIALRYE